MHQPTNSTTRQSSRTTVHPTYQIFSKIRQSETELMIQQFFPVCFRWRICCPLLLKLGEPIYTKFREDIGTSIVAPRNVLYFRYIAPFRNQSNSNATVVENENQG